MIFVWGFNGFGDRVCIFLGLKGPSWWSGLVMEKTHDASECTFQVNRSKKSQLQYVYIHICMTVLTYICLHIFTDLSNIHTCSERKGATLNRELDVYVRIVMSFSFVVLCCIVPLSNVPLQNSGTREDHWFVSYIYLVF